MKISIVIIININKRKEQENTSILDYYKYTDINLFCPINVGTAENQQF